MGRGYIIKLENEDLFLTNNCIYGPTFSENIRQARSFRTKKEAENYKEYLTTIKTIVVEYE